MQNVTAALLVGTGGFVGAAARWGLGTVIQSTFGEPRFPYPTFIVNLLGCFAIGVAYALWGKHDVLRLLVIVGLLGGFTTFSAFGWETLGLIRNDAVGLAALYVGLSAALGVVLVWAGYSITSR